MITPDGGGNLPLWEVAGDEAAITDALEVRAFLTQRPDVRQALLAASPHIAAIFGGGCGVSLQVLVDHDGEEDIVLNALIQTPDPVEEALEKRRRFNRQWWSDARKTVKGLNFDVDCAEEH